MNIYSLIFLERRLLWSTPTPYLTIQPWITKVPLRSVIRDILVRDEVNETLRYKGKTSGNENNIIVSVILLSSIKPRS